MKDPRVKNMAEQYMTREQKYLLSITSPSQSIPWSQAPYDQFFAPITGDRFMRLDAFHTTDVRTSNALVP